MSKFTDHVLVRDLHTIKPREYTLRSYFDVSDVSAENIPFDYDNAYSIELRWGMVVLIPPDDNGMILQQQKRQFIELVNRKVYQDIAPLVSELQMQINRLGDGDCIFLINEIIKAMEVEK